MTSQPVTRRELPPGFEYVGTSDTIRVRMVYKLGTYREKIRRSTGTSNLEDAKHLKHLWTEEARQRALGITPATPASKAKGLTVAEYFKEFAHKRRNNPKQAVRVQRLKVFVEDCGAMFMNEFTADDAEQWRDRRLNMINKWGKRFQKSSVREDCNKVRAFFESARKAKVLKGENPWRDVDLPKGKPRNDEVSEEEQEALLAALTTDEDQRAVLMLLGTGLRNDEFHRTTLANMTLDGDDALIDVLETVGKGGKGRIIPLVPETVEVIKAQQAWRGLTAASTAPLWSYTNRKMLWHHICLACKRAGLRRITPKMFRQTYGIRLANNTEVVVPREFVKTALGHSSVGTTEKYYTRTQQQKFRATLRRVDLGLKTAPETA